MSRILNVLVASVVTFVITLTAATPVLAQVQPPEVEWENTFGGADHDQGFSVQQTTDGGYIVVGWTGSFGAGDVDVYLVKTDSLGNLVWQKTFGGANDDAGRSVQQTTDGGYIVVGDTQSFGSGYRDVYLVKTDSLGNLVWQKTFGGADHDQGFSIQQTADGGYIVAGITTSFGAGNTDVYLVKTDSLGNLVWQKTFSGANHDRSFTVQQTTDGGYIVVGDTQSFGAGSWDVYLVKTDSLGNLVWQNTFGGTNDDAGRSVQQTLDGGYIVAGWTGSFGAGSWDVYLVKTDSLGNLVWQKTFGGANDDRGRPVQQTLDGGYIVAGWTESFGAGGIDVYLVKTDSLGNLVWQKTFGGADYDQGFSIQQTTDGGYIVAGQTESFGAGGTDVYLIKLSPDQPPPPKPCTPDAEVYDEMQTELSHNIEVFGLGRVCTADLTGTIGVKRYLPYVDPATGLRTIATKITKLELTGTDPSCGEVKISLNPSIASGGKVVEQKAGTCFPADSYFDVYITVAIPSLNLTLANCKPATMRCVVSALPPIGCVYQIGTGFDVPLYDTANPNCSNPGNPVGQISAAEHKPTAAPPPPPPPPPQRTQLNLFHQNQWLPLTDPVRKDHFLPSEPVVVIVHGWNKELLDPLPSWTAELAAVIISRLPNQVNLLAWDWQEEAKGGTDETNIATRLQYASNYPWDQSGKLARALQQLFNVSGFQQPIHLMGHSFGAHLVTFTALRLQSPSSGNGSYPVANVTLWDPPDAVPNSLANNVPYLRLVRGTTVDCFSGTFNDRAYFSNAWYAVLEGGHDTYRWYLEHALPASEPTLHQRIRCNDAILPSTVGFGASRTHAPAERQLRFTCQPQELDVSLVAHSSSRQCQLNDQLVFAQYCVAGTLTDTPVITVRVKNGIGDLLCDCTVPPDLKRLRMRLRRPAGMGAGGQAEALAATFTLPLTISAEFDSVSFTYRIEAAPSPATLTLSIQDGESVVPLFLATSDTDLGEGDRDSPLLNITPYHGKEVNLIFSLASDQPDAIVEVSNLTLAQGPFHDNVVPVSNAGANQAVAVTDPISTTVSLDGSGTDDANGDPLVYVWTATQDPAVAGDGIVAVGEQPTVELPLGGYQFTLHARDPFDGFSSDDVIVEVEYPFTRGDSNADGKVDITDAIATLTSLFLDTSKSICLDAADTNDDAAVNISDPIALLNYLFLGTSPAPRPPTFPNVGIDPTPDLLGCDLKQP